MSQLTRQQDDLAPVMTFVRDEIRKDMSHVERQISPCVGCRGRNSAAVLKSEFEQACDAPTALNQAL